MSNLVVLSMTFRFLNCAPGVRLSRRAALGLTLAAAAALAGCGGGDDVDWDPLNPRDPTVADIAGESFVFTGFSYGAVFDPSLDRATTTLTFGASQAAGAAFVLPFSLAANGGVASGSSTLDGARLTLVVAQPHPALPFAAGQVLNFDLQADVDDGRIGLTNRDSGVQQTSAPR
ncbi:MAG: hypothetical protein KF788_22505 [Piscinibacter sp.]|nr:hypothetical protein [Piscinibacter sp.]